MFSKENSCDSHPCCEAACWLLTSPSKGNTKRWYLKKHEMSNIATIEKKVQRYVLPAFMDTDFQKVNSFAQPKYRVENFAHTK